MDFEEAKERFQPNLNNIIEEIKDIHDLRQIVVSPERTYCDVFAVFDERQWKHRRRIRELIFNISSDKTIIDRNDKPDLDIWIKTRFSGLLATIDWYDEEVYRDAP